MATTAAPSTTDRSDFRGILLDGTKIGVATAVAVVVFLAVSRLVPAGLPRSVLEAIVVLGAGCVASFLPGHWVAARHTPGIAAAAGIGLWGTVIFSAIDIVVLRPFKAYPWTWDAIGGGSSWWYLPVWWQLGTFLAWQGGMLTAGLAARGETGLGRAAVPVLAGAVVLTLGSRLAGLPVAIPVAAGVGFAVVLTALAITAIVRKA